MCVLGPCSDKWSEFEQRQHESDLEKFRPYVEAYIAERKRQFEADRPRGLRSAVIDAGWQFPNCGSAHGPNVATCPEPPKGSNLKERISQAHNEWPAEPHITHARTR